MSVEVALIRTEIFNLNRALDRCEQHYRRATGDARYRYYARLLSLEIRISRLTDRLLHSNR